ncbi:hypothetical protein PUN28_009057 [Cardiocondyla obscurior]|uniref:FAM20 C-terminal domain-containing protein n=1 Tax=Cardiocondyla obscurior TaxID=286306 RepID=A0AAW2FQ91_9HYME
MQLTKKDGRKNVELSKSTFEENVCSVTNDTEKIPRPTIKSSSPLQWKYIPDDSQLTEGIVRDDFILTKNLISLSEKEENIPVVLRVGRNAEDNFSLTKDPYSLANKHIFTNKQDVSALEREKDIPEENVSPRLTKNIVRNSLSRKSPCAVSERDISLTEKEEKLSRSTRKSIQESPLTKKYSYLTAGNQTARVSFSRLKQIKNDSINQCVITHRRYLAGDARQPNRGSEKKVRKGSNSVRKVKRSPPPEEDWLGQESTGSDNNGSADKCDSVVTCKLMVSNSYAERQSVAEPPEEHIKIFKISPPRHKRLIDNYGSAAPVDFAEGESVPECPSFEKEPKDSKDPASRANDGDKNSKYQVIEVQEPVVTLSEPIREKNESGEITTSQVTEVDIYNLLTFNVIHNLEAPHQQLTQRDTGDPFDINRELHEPVDPFIIRAKEDFGKTCISKKSLDKREDPSVKARSSEGTVKNSSVKKCAVNSSRSKVTGNFRVLNNQRLIGKPSVITGRQLDNSQLALIGRKPLGSEKKLKPIDKRSRENPKMRLNVRLIRIRDKLVLCLSALAIVFTLLLVMDLQMDLGYSGHHLNPSHARVRIGDPPDADTVYNNFRRRFLQRGNGSREQANSDVTSAVEKSRKNEATPVSSTMRKHDDFTDLVDLVVNGYAANVDEGVARISGEDRDYNPTIREMRKMTIKKNSTTLEKFHLQISRLELYAEDSKYVDQLLHEMATKPILHVVQKDGGTQLKLVIDYGDNMQALFKPMRFPREQQTLPNHFYFTDFERHTAEIASFHLDRLLGFRRAMPVTGRTLNVTTEVYQIADGELLKTFFVSPAGNLCFHGKCSYYCDTAHAVCGSPDTLEGSFAAFLPDKAFAARKAWRHPWRRSYHKRKKAQWEHGEAY